MYVIQNKQVEVEVEVVVYLYMCLTQYYFAILFQSNILI